MWTKGCISGEYCVLVKREIFVPDKNVFVADPHKTSDFYLVLEILFFLHLLTLHKALVWETFFVCYNTRLHLITSHMYVQNHI